VALRRAVARQGHREGEPGAVRGRDLMALDPRPPVRPVAYRGGPAKRPTDGVLGASAADRERGAVRLGRVRDDRVGDHHGAQTAVAEHWFDVALQIGGEQRRLPGTGPVLLAHRLQGQPVPAFDKSARVDADFEVVYIRVTVA